MGSSGVFSGRVALFALLLGLPMVAGCGLTLDYSPPDDGGFDAARDGSTSSCATGCGAGQVCANGECRQACTTASDCSDDSLCEKCEEGACLPAPTDLCLPDGCFLSTCDPALDACGSPVDTCAEEGLACVDGSCTEIPCGTSADCTDFRDPNDCPFVCNDASHLCQAVGICAQPPGDCHSFDPCTCSVSDVPDPTRCPAERPLCDGSTFQCAGCIEAADCTSPELPLCDPVTQTCVACVGNTGCLVGQRCEPTAGVCVECVDDSHCAEGVCDFVAHVCIECRDDSNCGEALPPLCDLTTGTCVECVANTDCPPGEPVCNLTTHQCGGCVFATDCGTGTCVGGRCELPTCVAGSTCPAVGTCATSTGCVSGACTYMLDDTACNDGIPCTSDICDPALARGEVSGCIHVPDPAFTCDDHLSCTDDVCRPSVGCVSLPRDRLCGTSGVLGCATPVCVGAEMGAMADPITGCGLTYSPCGAGEICDLSGICVGAPPCARDIPCPDDGNPCTPALTCRLTPEGAGTCVPVAITGDVCRGVSACGTYCSADGCALRTNGGGLCVDPAAL